MIGIIVILTVSWTLLYFIEKKNILALGLLPPGKRIIQFAVGFVFIAALNLLLIYVESLVKDVQWSINSSIEFSAIFESLWYHFKSALTEDLIFRGALLYIFIHKLGRQKALALSAIAFGVYHWFSYGMFGSGIIPMVYVFVITGLSGYVWGLAFAKTRSILMPLGFHMGWNFVTTLFYKAAPYGELIFLETSRTQLTEWNDSIYSILNGLAAPLLTLVFVKYFVKEDKGQGLIKKSNDEHFTSLQPTDD